MKLQRYWINAPSTLQADHPLHGMLVLADPSSEAGPCCDSYPIHPTIHSMRVTKLTLSPGWPSHLFPGAPSGREDKRDLYVPGD